MYLNEALRCLNEAIEEAIERAETEAREETIANAVGVARRHAEGYEKHYWRYYNQGKHSKGRRAMDCMDAAKMIANEIEMEKWDEYT